MSEVMSLEVVDGIAVITINSPPVNAIGINVRRGIVAGFEQAIADDDVKAIVLICEGRTFFAGADISEFGKPPIPPSLPEVTKKIEDSSKPTIAAIHGNALGGGLEVALNCHFRIAVPSTKAGLPEVNLGIIPGAGGTQRLTRIVGAKAALDIIGFGKPFNAEKALSLGVFDALASEDNLLDDAIAFARKIVDNNLVLTAVRDREDKISEDRKNPALFDEFRKKHARKFRGFKAPEVIVQCVEDAVNLPFDEGIKLERSRFEALRDGVQSAAQRYAFFSERESAKVPDISRDITPRNLASVGVIGAGTMGGGIAMNFLNAGIPVLLVEVTQEALERGISVIRKNYENTAKKGRMTNDQVEQRMALITPSLEYNALAEADLVIEAVFESMDIKKSVFAQIDNIAKPGAILASNTSYLDLDEIAAATSRPEDVIGLHFFSPANVMPLLEIVRGKVTSKDVLATALKLSKTIGKTPVVSGVCYGFIANRAMSVRRVQADELALQGLSPADIDRVMYDFGFAMGPFQMKDLVGLDVIGRDSTEKTVASELVARGRLGQKKNGGYYDYDENRKPSLSPIALEIIQEIASEQRVTPVDADDEEILARLLYPVINEGARILEEGIAIRASDIDVACVKGYNWPVFHGGPMFWADTVGLEKIVSALQKYARQYGDEFAPSPLLVSLAAEGKKLAEFGKQ